ncbi:MAG: MFS transporter [Spirochaetes bacterium]|nr:MFS transporter [Spirochaetota bacterium]
MMSLKEKIGFGICDLGGNLFFTVMGFYLLYYLTDTVGLPAHLAGTALMIGKIWDAVTDPIVGNLSDRTRTRWGRRKPWMTAGAFLLFGGMLFLFHKPSWESPGYLFAWATFAYCLVNTAYTFVSIPYGALTPELTSDYHEQTLLNGYRQVFAILGTFLGTGIVLPLVTLPKDPGKGWFFAGGVLGGIMLVSALLTVILVGKERIRIGRDKKSLTSWDAEENPSSGQSLKQTTLRGFFKEAREVLQQRTFLLVLIPWTLHISGVTLLQNAMVYYFEYIFQQKEGFQIALMILLSFALLCIPLWIHVSRKLGKKEVYNRGMLIFAATVMVFFFFGHRVRMGWAYVLMIPAGIGFSVQYAMPFAILPDVVVWDLSEHGKRREGVYYGLWTFASKMGQSIAFLVSGWVLAVFGYIPLASQQSPIALLGIRVLAGVLPAILFFLGVMIHRHYPIDPETYQQIEARIRSMEQERPL